MFEVAIVGGGPAGLSAAVNAGAEGLETILLADHIGGQAGTSSRIENFLGFPEGISGPALTDRACKQAQKFGVLLHDGHVDLVEQGDVQSFNLYMRGGAIILTKSVIVACGVQYNIPGWARPFGTRHGIHYACTAQIVKHGGHETVAVVGGGNSAGQAAMYLSEKVKHVHLIVRGEKLHLGMSHYLCERVLHQANITIHYKSEIVRTLTDHGHISDIVLADGTTLPVSDVYIMIGAKPNCDFLNGIVDLDDHGFIKTNALFETNTPGIYAVGDIRAGSIKRVANAAGEGAACIQRVWSFIRE